jgi:NAD-dependent dihydropyrimidine dehydrogenase PreA subunit
MWRLYGARSLQVVNPQRCSGCGLCMDACPKDAIQLAPRGD